jgi:hypothetical protein
MNNFFYYISHHFDVFPSAQVPTSCVVKKPFDRSGKEAYMRPALLLSILIPIAILAAGCTLPGAATSIPTAASSLTSTVQTIAPTAISTAPAGSGTIGAPTSAAGCPPTGTSADWKVYCDEEYGFSIQYPAGAVLSEPEPDLTRIDLAVIPGTNLGEKYLEISTQHSSQTCTSPLAEGSAPGSLASKEVEFNGTTFTNQSGADAGAGNFYDWTAYSTGREGVCVSFGFVLHSTNPMNYPTPPPEYDTAAESAVFEEIMNTFGWIMP